MRFVTALFSVILLSLLSSCAPQSDEARTTQESGGTLPWNRPEKWESGGALGSQMQQFSQ